MVRLKPVPEHHLLIRPVELGLQGGQRQRRKIEERGLPLNQQRNEVWTERVPAEGDRLSQAVAGSECLVLW